MLRQSRIPRTSSNKICFLPSSRGLHHIWATAVPEKPKEERRIGAAMMAAAIAGEGTVTEADEILEGEAEEEEGIMVADVTMIGEIVSTGEEMTLVAATTITDVVVMRVVIVVLLTAIGGAIITVEGIVVWVLEGMISHRTETEEELQTINNRNNSNRYSSQFHNNHHSSQFNNKNSHRILTRRTLPGGRML
jgi:hypothetical protein